MRLGYVNHWFVEVLGDHDQFQNLNNRVSPSNSSIDQHHNSSLRLSLSPGQIVRDSHNKPSLALSPGQIVRGNSQIRSNSQSPNDLEDKSDLPRVLNFEKMPNLLGNALSTSLPNNLLASHPMNLPVSLPNVLTLPIASDGNIYPSPYSVAATALFSNTNHGEIVYPTMAQMNQSYVQDAPLPLVKVKKEPNTSLEASPRSLGSSSPNTNGYIDHSRADSPKLDYNKTTERAKARKRFTPSQLMPNMMRERGHMFDMHRPIITAAQAEAAVNLGMGRNELDPRVKRELRDFVTRREMDRSPFFTSSPILADPREEQTEALSLSTGSEENSRSSYTYVWDGEMTTSDQHHEDGVSMETENEEKVARLLSRHVHGSRGPWKSQPGKVPIYLFSFIVYSLQ